MSCYSDHNEDIRTKGSCDYCGDTQPDGLLPIGTRARGDLNGLYYVKTGAGWRIEHPGGAEQIAVTDPDQAPADFTVLP